MFRKYSLILILTLVVLSVSPSFCQSNPPLSGIVMGSATATENFDRWSSGLQLGFEYGVDQKAGVSIRTLYTRWRFGDPDLQTIRANVKWDWYSCSNFCFYLLAGVDAWIDDFNNGSALMTGVGLGWTFYRAKGEWQVPFEVSLLTELVFSDANDPTDNTGQINVGLRFSRPLK